VGIGLLVLFLFIEAHVRSPLVDLELFRNIPYVLVTGAGMVGNMAFCLMLFLSGAVLVAMVQQQMEAAQTTISISNHCWHINDTVTYPGTRAEGLLLNVRMVNAVFEDRSRPDFDAEANTDEFIAQIPDYVSRGIRAFTICLQGGMPGYEGAVNSAFNSDGSLRETYLSRVARVIRACDQSGAAVILGLYYQRQSKLLHDEAAVRAGVVNAAKWVRDSGFKNVVLEIANEYPHKGFVHPLLRKPKGEAELIRLARQTAPGLLVSTSGIGDGKLDDEVAEASDFLLIHFNSVPATNVPARIVALKKFGKPIVCNEDDRPVGEFPAVAESAVANGCSHGLMLIDLNQRFPFTFKGAADAPGVYATYQKLTTVASPVINLGEDTSYFPPPESQGGWRKAETTNDIAQLAGVDPRARLPGRRLRSHPILSASGHCSLPGTFSRLTSSSRYCFPLQLPCSPKRRP
jgi:hypothetical protein